MASEKSFQPTQAKLKKARKEGKVVKSQVVTQGFVLLVVFFVIVELIKITWFRSKFLINFLEQQPQASLTLLAYALIIFFLISFAVILAGSLVGVVTEGLQTKGLFEVDLCLPKAERLNPVKGLKKVFSNLKNSWLKLLIFAVLILIGAKLVRKYYLEIFSMFGLNSTALVQYFYETTNSVSTFLALGLVLMGIFEYLVNRKQFYKELSMSSEELKREFREQEGDQYIKSMRKSIHEEVLRTNLVNKVKGSKVIVVSRSNSNVRSE